MAGAILHDIGKIYELTYSRAFGYSIEGTLIGHISIGLAMLEQKARVSHSSHTTFWSCLSTWLSVTTAVGVRLTRGAAMSRALLLHYLDQIDSKMGAMLAAIEANASSPEVWSARIQSLGHQCWIFGNTWDTFLTVTPRVNPAAPRHTLTLPIIGARTLDAEFD